jgi:dTDP-4-amino-4,6-dideoxygalactose transaminase
VVDWERSFSERTAAPFAVSFAYARTALAALLTAAGLEPGDEVLLSPLTCKVVPLALLAAGLKPVYQDIRADTLNLDATALEPRPIARARAVLFQRTYGNAAGVNEAAAFARAHGLFFVEDCAQCMPSRSAWCGDAAIFSSNAGKPLSAGSGGVALMRNGALADRVRSARDALPGIGRVTAIRSTAEAWVRNHALTPARYWTAFNLNRRMDPSYHVRPLAIELRDEFTALAARLHPAQAAAGLQALADADAVARHRTECCDSYATMLRDVPGVELPCRGGEPLYYFPVLTERKEAVLRAAQERRLEIIAWPVRAPIYPLEDTAALEQYGYSAGSCPVAEKVAARLIGLPTHPLIDERHRQALRELLRANGAVQ